MKEIMIEELMAIHHPVIIDVRSPIEFQEGAIPGAINVPLFSNEERHEIGIIYKNEGQPAAKWRAMEMVSPKIPHLMNTIKCLADKEHPPIIHCWRGGLRSKSVVTFLEFAGIPSKRLVGGYKAYRQYILKKLPEIYPQKAVVLHGLTGVGKTEILNILHKKGFPTLDLEYMAGHRGSIFGTIGIGEGRNQKTFDSLLFHRLTQLNGSAYFIIEAESKRIGRIVQPEEIIEKKRLGHHILIHTPMEQRVEHITNEYILPYQNEDWYDEKIHQSMERIAKRLPLMDIKKALYDHLEKREYREMIEILLQYYYDPRYDHKRDEYEGEFIEIQAENPEDAAEKIYKHLISLFKIESKQS